MEWTDAGKWQEEKGNIVVNASLYFQIAVVLQTSLRGVLARKAAWFGILVFGLCLLILFPFSFGTDLVKQDLVRTGVFWMVQEFLVVQLVGRIFAVESEQGALELMLNPGFSRRALLLGKILFTFLQLLTLQLPICLVWWALYEIPVAQTRALAQVLLPVLVLFNLGTSCLGVMLNSLTARSLGREILVPILFFPLQISVLLAAVQLTVQDAVLLPKGGFSNQAWWSILAGFPLIFGGVALLLENALFEE